MDISKLKAALNTTQYFEGDKKSKIFERYGLSVASATDYANYPYSESHNRGKRYFIYTNTDIGYINVYGLVDNFDNSIDRNIRIGIRPILDYSHVDLPDYRLFEYNDDLFILKYGFFPQKYLIEPKNNTLIKTNNYYINTNEKYNKLGYSNSMLNEYYYKIDSQKEYRIVNFGDNSNCYFLVEPLYWYVDKKNKILISKKIISSLLSANNITRKDIINYINDCFLEEIVQNETIDLISNKKIIVPSKDTLESNVSLIKKRNYY